MNTYICIKSRRIFTLFAGMLFVGPIREDGLALEGEMTPLPTPLHPEFMAILEKLCGPFDI